jgi:hypothetical protein
MSERQASNKLATHHGQPRISLHLFWRNIHKKTSVWEGRNQHTIMATMTMGQKSSGVWWCSKWIHCSILPRTWLALSGFCILHFSRRNVLESRLLSLKNEIQMIIHHACGYQNTSHSPKTLSWPPELPNFARPVAGRTSRCSREKKI